VEQVNMVNIFTVLCMSGLLFFVGSSAVFAQNEVAQPSQKTVTIESTVKGSQEQPKVLYIMPWQGISQPITVKNKEIHLTLPNFKPINPKHFRQEVRDFARQQSEAN